MVDSALNGLDSSISNISNVIDDKVNQLQNIATSIPDFQVDPNRLATKLSSVVDGVVDKVDGLATAVPVAISNVKGNLNLTLNDTVNAVQNTANNLGQQAGDLFTSDFYCDKCWKHKCNILTLYL